MNQNNNNNINVAKHNNKISKTNLSFASLILTILQLIMPFVASLSEHLSFLGTLPYIIAALILAIISKCKYDDKLSLIMIIVDTVLIGITIVFTILAILLFASVLEALFSGCNDLSA